MRNSIYCYMIVASISFSGQTHALSIGKDCEPKGVVAIAKESFDSKSFWAKQLREINDYIEGQRTVYRLSIIERRRAQANAALDAEEMRAAGIPQTIDPQLAQELRQTDREIAAMDLQLLQDAVSWGERCSAYARQKLGR